MIPPSAPRPRGPRWSDHQIDLVVGRLLQVGVLTAALVTLFAGVAYLLRYGGASASYAVFGQGAPAMLRGLAGIVHGIRAGHLAAMVQAGLVLLILTPMARVALTLGVFVLQRDRLYVVLTAIVLAVLVYGLFWAHA